MTSCLCAKVVIYISWNFNLCDFKTLGYARIHYNVQYCIRMEITVLYFKLCGHKSWFNSRKSFYLAPQSLKYNTVIS